VAKEEWFDWLIAGGAWLDLAGIEGNSEFEPRLRFAMIPLPGDTTVTLQLRPNCEYCDKDLPPHSIDARICSYECTFCADCADNKLANVCPNCGGGFVSRPIRPTQEWRPGVCVLRQPPSEICARGDRRAFAAGSRYPAGAAVSRAR
jgi:hypothetical protein